MFIVIEGLDGSGKTTLLDGLVKRFQAIGKDVVRVREPGSTPVAEQIRTLLKSPDFAGSMTDLSELLLFYAARRSTLEHVAIPALKQNKIVLYDRFNVSTIAYQGFGLGLLPEVQNLTKMILSDFRPDVYIYVDVPEEIALERRKAATELDRIESKGPEYLKRVRQGFEVALKDCESPVIVVDGKLSIDELADVTFNELRYYLEAPNAISSKTTFS